MDKEMGQFERNLRILLLVATAILCCTGVTENAFAKAKVKTFQNPILTGFHPDPSICRVGKDFYLTNSTFEFFPGLPIYHSRDLVHWEQIGNALDRPGQIPLKGATDSGGLYAPTLRYWKGLFYLTCDNVSGGGNFIVTAKDPAGPWSEPIWLNDYGIDGSLFFDDNEKVYYSRASTDGQNGVMLAELDPQTLKPLAAFKRIWGYPDEWNEGPHLYKLKGKYYLLAAVGGTETHHQEVVARGDSPWGPFESSPVNPMVTERDDPESPIQCTGHADLFDTPDGSSWLVFLGTRPQSGLSVLGRETFLAPVHWTKEGWPVAGKDHHVALEMEAPKLKPFSVAAPKPRTLFDTAALGPEWLHIRNYDPKDLSLEERKGYLRIHAAKGNLDHRLEVPAFVGQRQPAFRLSARTSMEFKPQQDGEEAGLCVRANEDNHYEIGVQRFEGKTQLFVRNRVKNREYRMAQEPFNATNVELEIAGTEDRYQFSYSVDGKTWKALASSPSADLSREKAGGFTGSVIGLYATSNGQESQGYADFAWFEMSPGIVPDKVVFSARPPATPLSPADHWRIRAGGTEIQDKAGVTWNSDIGFSGGETAQIWHPIEGTPDVDLYRTERYGNDFEYTLPVVPGSYQVRLKFAETFVKKEGERLFDIAINGKKVLAKLDLFKEAKGFDKAFDEVLKDIHPDAVGNINIRFISALQNAKVCAIEVTRQR